MKLYFIPFACSLATRIAVEEAGLDAEFVRVAADKTLPDGSDFRRVSPMGYVPALETPGGLVLTEGPAVLSYIAELAAEGVLAPPPFSDAHYRMLAWLNFVSTEIHKSTFAVLFTPESDEAEKAVARGRVAKPFALLSAHLDGREHLGDAFSVADAYLLVVLNWCETAGVALSDWPVLHAWREKMRRRPSIARAMAEEWPLLKAA